MHHVQSAALLYVVVGLPAVLLAAAVTLDEAVDSDVDKRSWNTNFHGGYGKRALADALEDDYESYDDDASFDYDNVQKRAWNNGLNGYGKRAWNSAYSGGMGKRAWNSAFSGGMGKRAWNSGFTGGLGKRAWNSGYTGGMGKRAWNSGFSAGMGKRAWNSGFSPGMGKRAWNSGFGGGIGKRSVESQQSPAD